MTQECTLHECSMSAMARLLRFAVAMMSSWRQEFPAATAFAVAMVMPLVMRMNSSGVVVFGGGSELLNTCQVKEQGTISQTEFWINSFLLAGIWFLCCLSITYTEYTVKDELLLVNRALLTASSCLMCSMVLSKALVPFVASSSTAFTVFRRDVTLVTMTYNKNIRH